MTNYNYDPKSLNQVSSVEIVLLSGLDVDRISQYMQNASDAPTVIVKNDLTSKFTDLWRKLPIGHQERCHTPKYGLRFLSEDAGIVEASVCWECSNIFGLENGKPFHYEFDASAPSSIELLNLVKRTVSPRAA